MKAQVAAEFVLYSMIALIMITGLMAFLGGAYSDKKSDRAYYEVTNLGRNLQKELIVANEVKTGFERTIILPQTVLGENYSISNTAVQFSLTHDGKTQYFNTPMLSGTFVKGENTITTNETTIIIN